MKRYLTITYGAVAYLAFVAVFAYTIGFLANAVVPKGIDDGAVGPAWRAIAVDAGLLALFAVQHSVMARPWFKKRWVNARIERSTYVLVASAVVALLLWLWQPLPATVWAVEAPWARAVLWSGYVLGWVVLLLSTIQIGHFDLFGVRQVLDRTHREPEFREPLFYRLVRHPLMVGFLISFWSTPDMSVGRLLFAGAATGYILIAVRFEEHDLRAQLGDAYTRYAERVPRFMPRPTRKVEADARTSG